MTNTFKELEETEDVVSTMAKMMLRQENEEKRAMRRKLKF
jgi:hypothetical protein